MNESIMFDFIPNEIEFINEEMYDQLQSQLSLALQRTLNSEKYTFEQLENLLFFTQSNPICKLRVFGGEIWSI